MTIDLAQFEVVAIIVGLLIAALGFGIGHLRGNPPPLIQIVAMFVAGAGVTAPAVILWTALQPSADAIKLNLTVRIVLILGAGDSSTFLDVDSGAST